MDKKQEALSQKTMAEELIRIQDYRGAREKLDKARKLYPELENIKLMMTLSNILLAYQDTSDWYFVLQTTPAAKPDHIASKYHALRDSLEPLKYVKFPGTDLALSVLDDAFYVLFDEKRRSVFDSERLRPKTPKKMSGGDEIGRKWAKPTVGKLQLGSANCYQDFGNIRKKEMFKVGQIWAAYDSEGMPRRYARIDYIVISEHLPFELGVTWLKPVPANKDEKMWCEAGLPVACGDFEFDKCDMAGSNNQTMFSHMVSQIRGFIVEKVEICPRKGEVWALFEGWEPFEWCKDPKARVGCGYMMVEILVGYSMDAGVSVVCLEKVAGLKSVYQRCMHSSGKATFTIPANHLQNFSHNVPAFRFKGGEKAGISSGMLELDLLAVPKNMVEDTTRSSWGRSSRDCSSLTDSNSGVVLVNCRWSRKDFSADQVWAVYDAQDSMPRRYVLVKNVVSGTEVCATSLEPQPLLDEDIHWVEENFPSVCGLYRVGKMAVNLGMVNFSHVVSCEFNKTKSIYRIYPRKGEVWAIYKDWHPKWKSSDYKCHRCQIVEVLSDFSEGADMKISCLVEVKDFKAFFQRQLCSGFELIRKIPRTEMLSFSHQIPCFVVPGIESSGLPEGSLLLEPDALPLNRAK